MTTKLSLAEILLPIALFLIFTLLSAVGIWLILSRRSRAAATWGVLGTLFFYVVLFAGMVWILRDGGFL